ncbi:MAG: SAM-dependent methyltransferase [Bacteroidetes bacterium]|nr:SAM-dependent methyltransferase [Bacteroidota bacterium]
MNLELIKLILSNKRIVGSDLKSIIITAVKLKAGMRWSFVYRHQTKDITKNFETVEAISLINAALENDFLNADLFTTNETIQITHNSKGEVKLKTTPANQIIVPSFSHDKVKNRLIALENNIYLRELGVVNSNWQLKKEMADKYVQINKYIELLEPEIRELPEKENLDIVDMGSGKGYLTFALYDYLTNKLNFKANITGIEFRQDMVDLSNQIAKNAGFENLKFEQGTIEKSNLKKVDILIALHACDTATDEAIFKGISSNASLIVCAPCCHKQIRKEMSITSKLCAITKHGILEERTAETITDGLRALIMEAFGYKTKVFEFISGEHTPKNVMIIGRKMTAPVDKEKILNEISKIKLMFGIKTHQLEVLLNI